MARIRTVKPEFFRHELLQELEIKHPDLHPMLVFEGLWCQADKNGTFLWRPKYLHLDILPFIPFDLGKTLDVLNDAGLIGWFEVDGVEYGFTATFGKHQRITGTEKTDPPKFPPPPAGILTKRPGNNGETSGKQSGDQEREREREREREKEKEGKFPPASDENSETVKSLRIENPNLVADLMPDLLRVVDRGGDYFSPLELEDVSVLVGKGCTVEDFAAAFKVTVDRGLPKRQIRYLRGLILEARDRRLNPGATAKKGPSTDDEWAERMAREEGAKAS